MLAHTVRICRVIAVAGLAAWLGLSPAPAAACPFCSAVSMTLSEEMKASSVAVLAKMVSAPTPPGEGEAAATLDAAPLKFEIVETLKGAEALGDVKEFQVVYFGQGEAGSLLLVMGADPPTITWGTPLLLSPAAVDYVRQLPKLPETGADRLKFFQEFLNSTDDLLGRDAYDEFARAPYADVKGLKEHMNLPELRAAVMNKELPASRRRLFLTMLGVCGGPDDLPMLEQMLTANDPQLKTTLDAMIACYLTLKGPDGLTLVEDQFFRRQDAEFTDTYAAIVALRFHGQEEKIVPKERLVQAFRLMLDRPNYADLVIPDLARWEDWESMPRLVTLFKEADDDSSWVRVPVVQFLRQCPLPEAKERIAELEQIDPDAVKRANSFLPFPVANAPVPPAGETSASPADAAPAEGAAPDDPFIAAGKTAQDAISEASAAAPDDGPATAVAAIDEAAAAAQAAPAVEPAAAPSPSAASGDDAAAPPAAAETAASSAAGAPVGGDVVEPADNTGLIAAVVGGSLLVMALLYFTMFGGRRAA